LASRHLFWGCPAASVAIHKLYGRQRQELETRLCHIEIGWELFPGVVTELWRLQALETVTIHVRAANLQAFSSEELAKIARKDAIDTKDRWANFGRRMT
jgi:hypothetical protein